MKGIDVFKAHFAGFAHQYVLIGGAACRWIAEVSIELVGAKAQNAARIAIVAGDTLTAAGKAPAMDAPASSGAPVSGSQANGISVSPSASPLPKWVGVSNTNVPTITMRSTTCRLRSQCGSNRFGDDGKIGGIDIRVD